MGLALDEPAQDDKVFDIEPLRFVIAKEIADRLPEVKIDYSKTLFGKGFTVTTGLGC